MTIAFLATLVLVVFVVLFMLIGIYNGLVRLKNQVDRAWSNIDVVLKQRFDEIPQLVQVLEQFAHYEKSVIDQLVNARKHYGTAHSVGEKIQASNEISMALRGVFAIGENYPELKSNQNFTQLQGRISALEDSIADRRENYNEAVTNFNTRIDQIPDVFFARTLGYSPRELYQVDEGEKARPSLAMRLPK